MYRIVSPGRRARAMAAALAVALIAVSVPGGPSFAAPPPRSDGFVRFGWVSPPPESTTLARIQEYADAGFDVLLPDQVDLGRAQDNLRRMDFAAAVGIRALVFDGRLDRFADAAPLDPESPAGAALLDSIVADYRDHPGFFGWYLGDEPRAPWATLRRISDGLLKRDPHHPVWNDLLGRMGFGDSTAWHAYVRSYLDSMPASILCADHYEFRVAGDRGDFFEHAGGMRAEADAHGLPFWSVSLLIQHLGYRAVTPGMLRWQISNLLAYGARGIGLFTYWTPVPDPYWDWHDGVIRTDGTRSDRFGEVQALMRETGAIGRRLASMRWLRTECTVPVPSGAAPFAGDDWVTGVTGRVTLGRFVDAGGDPQLVLVNRDSLAAHTPTLSLRGVAAVFQLDAAADVWNPVPMSAPPSGIRTVQVALRPGACVLLRLQGTRGEGVDVLAPRLSLAGQPAHGSAMLRLEHLDAGARLELFDALGRRVRTWSPAAGDGTVRWSGERDDGGRAAAGVYRLRLRDGRGEVTATLVWLGP